MAIASADRVRLAYVVEQVPGTTPTTPALQIVRLTGESLDVTRENIVSSELRADRNVMDLIQVGGGAGGGVEFELSYGTYDDWLASALQSSWSGGSAEDPDKIVASTDMINGAYTVADNPATPARLTVTRTVVGEADTPGKITITGVGVDDSIISDEITPGATGVTVTGTKIFKEVTFVVGSGWTSDGTADQITVGVAAMPTVLKNGSTPKSFTLERTLLDLTPNAYFRFKGMQANRFSLTCTTKEIVKGSFDFLGMSGEAAEEAVAGASYLSASTTEVMDAASDFAGFSVAGLSGVHVSSLSLDATNNLRAPTAAGSVDALGIGAGRFELSGSIEAYFEDIELYEAFLDGDATALAFTLGSTAGEKYTFTMPNIKFETGTVQAQGNDSDIMASMTYRGLYDSVNGCTLMIERGVA